MNGYSSPEAEAYVKIAFAVHDAAVPAISADHSATFSPLRFLAELERLGYKVVKA